MGRLLWCTMILRSCYWIDGVQDFLENQKDHSCRSLSEDWRYDVIFPSHQWLDAPYFLGFQQISFWSRAFRQHYTRILYLRIHFWFQPWVYNIMTKINPQYSCHGVAFLDRQICWKLEKWSNLYKIWRRIYQWAVSYMRFFIFYVSVETGFTRVLFTKSWVAVVASQTNDIIP